MANPACSAWPREFFFGTSASNAGTINPNVTFGSGRLRNELTPLVKAGRPASQPAMSRAVTGFTLPGETADQSARFKISECSTWVSGGETAEFALALVVRGDREQARRLLVDVQRLRHADGSYWTGYQYTNEVLWPDERTTWTAGAVLLATAAIAGERATTATFSGDPDQG